MDMCTCSMLWNFYEKNVFMIEIKRPYKKFLCKSQYDISSKLAPITISPRLIIDRNDIEKKVLQHLWCYQIVSIDCLFVTLATVSISFGANKEKKSETY